MSIVLTVPRTVALRIVQLFPGRDLRGASARLPPHVYGWYFYTRCSGLVTEAEALASHCWPRPEVSDNVSTTELGSLKLTANDERAIVAFLETLSDESFSGPGAVDGHDR